MYRPYELIVEDRVEPAKLGRMSRYLVCRPRGQGSRLTSPTLGLAGNKTAEERTSGHMVAFIVENLGLWGALSPQLCLRRQITVL